MWTKTENITIDTQTMQTWFFLLPLLKITKSSKWLSYWMPTRLKTTILIFLQYGGYDVTAEKLENVGHVIVMA